MRAGHIYNNGAEETVHILTIENISTKKAKHLFYHVDEVPMEEADNTYSYTLTLKKATSTYHKLNTCISFLCDKNSTDNVTLDLVSR